MRTMLEYQKMILEKVSFDKNIFRKELQKSIKWLTENDFTKLLEWVWNKFGGTHADVITNTTRLVLLPDNRMTKPGKNQ